MRTAAVMMVCLVALLALPTAAHAAAPFISEYPVGTLHTSPSVVAVDLFGVSVKPNTASITVNGTTYAATVVARAASGHWTSQETDQGNGYFTIDWTWTADPGGVNKVTLYCHPSTIAAGGPYTVAAHVTRDDGTVLNDTWTFSLASNGTGGTSPTAYDNSLCTACHGTGFNTDNAMGPDCHRCHSDGFSPAHGVPSPQTGDKAWTLTDAHATLAANISNGPSSACGACHRTDVTAVGSRAVANGAVHVPAVPADAVQEHQGCLCHDYGEVKPGTGQACATCHTGAYGDIHGFANQIGPGNTELHNIGGHNTTTYGKLGGYTKFDGSEGIVVKDSNNDTITQTWPLPTSGVFWSQTLALNTDGSVAGSLKNGVSWPAASLNPTDNPTVAMDFRGGTNMAGAVRTDVGWDSVITCQDCHTALVGVTGPQGANIGNYALDPNFPDDWTRAEITSFDPTGMRSIETTRGPSNAYYTMYGGNVNTNATSILASATVTATSLSTIRPGGFYNMGSAPSNGYSAADRTGRFICQKCHKLTNSFQGLCIEGNGRGFRSNNANYMGFSNEAHMEHHADMVTGQANCVSCHIAIPHGWKRPRLLVYESDPAPYKVQWYFPNYNTATVTQLKDQNPNMAAPNGNWGWAGWGSGSNPSNYKLVGAAIPNGSVGATSAGVWTAVNGIDAGGNGTAVTNAGKSYSSHLEKLSASSLADKEVENGAVISSNWAGADATNGTQWGKWVTSTGGLAWLPDESHNALYAGEAIQNNCTACTSAGLTHSDTGGTAEGVADNNVPGRQAWNGTFVDAPADTILHQGGGGTWAPIPSWK